MKHNFLTYLLLIGILFGMNSCKKTPSIVFFPDMYYPVAYDPLQEATLAYSDAENNVPLFTKNDGRTALDVVPGTIFRNKDGIVPMDWQGKVTADNHAALLAESKTQTESPLNPANKTKDLERGKHLYEITCAACHGKMGDGNGPIVVSGAYNGVPNYADREITIPSVYFVINNGLNMMGSYSGQLEMADRWRVAEYVNNEFKK